VGVAEMAEAGGTAVEVAEVADIAEAADMTVDSAAPEAQAASQVAQGNQEEDSDRRRCCKRPGSMPQHQFHPMEGTKKSSQSHHRTCKRKLARWCTNGKCYQTSDSTLAVARRPAQRRDDRPRGSPTHGSHTRWH
jgi:hypothetical protein